MASLHARAKNHSKNALRESHSRDCRSDLRRSHLVNHRQVDGPLMNREQLFQEEKGQNSPNRSSLLCRQQVRVFLVTHLYEFAAGFSERKSYGQELYKSRVNCS